MGGSLLVLGSPPRVVLEGCPENLFTAIDELLQIYCIYENSPKKYRELEVVVEELRAVRVAFLRRNPASMSSVYST